MKHFCSFSEAIREGSKIRPRQCFRKFFEGDDASCAVGAGIEAVLGFSLSVYEQLNSEAFTERVLPVAQMYPYLHQETAAPCGCETLLEGPVDLKTRRACADFSLYSITVHLNNFHRWTREQTADWLETEEEKLGFVHVVESESSIPLDSQVVGV